MAEALRDWLPNIIQAVEPWTSSSDIDAGARWNSTLSEQLQETQLGVLCLTAENLNAPWLLFEAGALSKIIDKTRVCPYILDLEPTDITGPLAQFQAVKADENGTKKLLHAVNSALKEHALSEDRLNTIFNVFWPHLKEILLNIPKDPQGTKEIKRSLEDMVEEILRTVRDQSSMLSGLQSRSSSIDGGELVAGVVKFFNKNKNFGFIGGDDGKDYFLHGNDVNAGITVSEGDKVLFGISHGEHGPKAANVRKI
jgi:cold shock CspA family protein